MSEILLSNLIINSIGEAGGLADISIIGFTGSYGFTGSQGLIGNTGYTGSSADKNVDGGNASTLFLPSQIINGGSANG